MKLFILSVLFSTFQLIHFGECAWSFEGGDESPSEAGPKNWPKKFPACNGKRQSPINIETSKIHFDPSLQNSLEFSHYTCPCGGVFGMENNGKTLKIGVSDIFASLTLNKKKRFILDHLHFHWGSNSSIGSEHRFDGKCFPAELHFVHYDTMYRSFGVAAQKRDGLAVLGVMIKVGRKNLIFDKFLKHIRQVETYGHDVDISPFCLKSLLPKNTRDFCRYYGSLTTPPCSDNVIWTLFHEPIEISEEQLGQFRTLKDRDGKSVSNNFRPVQQINGREISGTFRAAKK